MTKEMKFYSIGCTMCGGVQFGNTDNGMQFIPVFYNSTMAQLFISEEEPHEDHPAKVIEIVVKMV